MSLTTSYIINITSWYNVIFGGIMIDDDFVGGFIVAMLLITIVLTLTGVI